MYAPSQWETTLQCNVVSHWLAHAQKEPWIPSRLDICSLPLPPETDVEITFYNDLIFHLKRWGHNKMVTNWQTFLYAFSWIKMILFLFKLCWSLFLMVKWTISQHWFRHQANTWTNDDQYLLQQHLASPGHNELNQQWKCGCNSTCVVYKQFLWNCHQ